MLEKDRELVHTQEKLQTIVSMYDPLHYAKIMSVLLILVQLRAIPLMKDIQGIKRGKCQHCQCSKYVPPEEYRSDNKFFCVYCGHRPAEHVQIEEKYVCSN